MIKLERSNGKLNITFMAVKMGNDWSVSILGGERPHVGATALAIPRKSMMDHSKISSSVSVLTVTGHKEDEVVVPVARRISQALNSVVVVTCGIHNDNINYEDITKFIKVVDDTVEEFILLVKKI